MMPNLSFVQPEQWLFLLGVCLPLSALWGYALLRCLHDARAESPAEAHPAQGPLHPTTWALLIVLTGWFGALAYLFSVALPRWMRRLHLGDLFSGTALLSTSTRKTHAPVP